MEENILQTQQEYQDKHVIPICLEEGDHKDVSEGKTLTIICETCTSIQDQTFNQCRSCGRLGDVQLEEYIAEQWHRRVDVSRSKGISLVYTGSLCTLGKIKTFGLLNRNLKLHKKTRIAVMDKKFVIQYASALRGQKIVISPIRKWDSDSRTEKAVRGYILIHRGEKDSSSSSDRASSVDYRDINLMVSPASSSSFCCVSPEKYNEEPHGDGNWSSQLYLSDKTFRSSPSTRSLCSYSSRLSENGPISKGFLHCVLRNGVRFFIYLMAEKPDEVFIASQLDVSTSDDRSLDYIYSFQCMPIRRHATSVSRIIGNMTVSCCVKFGDNGSRVTESEFVLHGISGDNLSNAKSSAPSPFKIRSLSKHMTCMFKSSHMNLKKTFTRSSEIDLDLENFLHKSHASDMHHMKSGPQMASVVIKEYENDCGKGKTTGGWGLNFLEKIAYLDSPFDLTNMNNCQKASEEWVRSITVLVPAGIHGKGTTGHGGSSSLVERWRTGGRCDCGGWDIGCPLTVLKNQSSRRVFLPKGMSIRDCSIDLFTEVAKQAQPVVRMVTLQEDLHAVYFQPNLSPLQSFSVGVAILHAEHEARCRKL